MVATDQATQGATLATARVRLNFEVIDRRLKELGHPVSDVGLADLVGLDRGTVWRYRNERLQPLLETAVRIADALKVPVQDLVERLPVQEAS